MPWMKHLSGLGLVMLNYNSYITPNMDGFNSSQCVLGHKAKISPSFEVTPKVVIYLNHTISSWKSSLRTLGTIYKSCVM